MEELLLAGALDGVLDLPEAITGATAGDTQCDVPSPGHRHCLVRHAICSSMRGWRAWMQESKRGNRRHTSARFPDRVFFIFT